YPPRAGQAVVGHGDSRPARGRIRRPRHPHPGRPRGLRGSPAEWFGRARVGPVARPMFPLLRSLTTRYLLQKWDRSALIALSIALGVATLVSARLLNLCVEAAAYDTTIPADVAGLYVQNGEPGVDWQVVDDLRAAHIPGVERVEPFVVLRVVMP